MAARLNQVSNAVDEPFRYIFSRAEIQRFGLRYPAVNIVEWYKQTLPFG